MDLEPKDLLAWQRLAIHRNVNEFRGLKLMLAPELARCFAPVVHEGQRRPYGVVIARESDLGEFGTLSDISDQEQLDAAADGIHTAAFCIKGKPRQLLRLTRPLESQEVCASLATWVDGIVACVDANGMIWVVSSDFVMTIDDRNGWTRPSIGRIVGELMQLAPTADARVLPLLSELAYSHFSPRKVGATFLYLLTDADSTAYQSGGVSIAPPGLSVAQQSDWSGIEHQLRYTDGAAVVERSGRLL